MLTFEDLKKLYVKEYEDFSFPDQPQNLYAPVNYILSIGGKRIRPLLVLASYNLFNDNPTEAFNAGLALEVFHNFSLLHDDIMDEADMRRGQQATHIKYDTNAAILSGDVMMIFAYKLLEKYEEKYLPLSQLFTKTAIEVCEGQRMDMDFENTMDVTIQDYLKMIELKTSVLIAAAMGMGGILAEQSEKTINHLYNFGLNMGIAFQIQDDILDTFGETAKVGKRIGGDILQKKKTYLYLKSLQLLSKDQAAEMKSLFEDENEIGEQELIDKVTDLFSKAHVKVHAEELKLVYQQLAMSHLDAVDVREEKKTVLREFAKKLLNRQH